MPEAISALQRTLRSLRLDIMGSRQGLCRVLRMVGQTIQIGGAVAAPQLAGSCGLSTLPVQIGNQLQVDHDDNDDNHLAAHLEIRVQAR